MNEEEFWKEFHQKEEEAKIQREKFNKQVIPSMLKLPLEGFVSDENKIVLSEDLEIEKVSEAIRDEFFQRAATLELGDYRHENNWFFLNYKFEDERRKIGGIDTGNRILIMAIFFAIGTEKLFRINKSQGFVSNADGGLVSIGISRIPNAPWFYDSNVNLKESQIENLKSLWPLFRETYTGQPHFALVSRRYYFSLIRNQWEDQLIDLIIALEALLIPEMEEANKGGKIAKRLSRMLKDYHMRGEVSRIALHCYNLRNKIVHGKSDFDGFELEIDPNLEQLRGYVKKALQMYLLRYKGLSPQELADRLEQMDGEQI